MTHFEVTREGKRFIIASLLVALAALNTGNNLIFLLFSLMLSFLLLSAMLVVVNMSGLSLAVGDGHAIYAGREASLRLEIGNSKQVVPSYSVHCVIADAIDAVYFGMIPGRQRVEKGIRMKFKRRGLYSYRDFQIRSGFPFILLNGKRSVTASGKVIVYPVLYDLGSFLLSSSATEGMEVSRLSSAADSMYSLREFRAGDDNRKIHWKASAKTGTLYVKEYAEYRGMKATVILDNTLPESGALFEKAVSLAASLARDLLAEGCFVRVVTCGKTISFGSGDNHLYKILNELAVIREEEMALRPSPEAGGGYSVTVAKSRQSLAFSYIGESVNVIYAEDV